MILNFFFKMTVLQEITINMYPGVQENINTLLIKNIPGMKNRTAYVTILLLFDFFLNS